MLKVWNVFLICLTFFLTIFGTFLTRSGLIASVHSFAQSGIGIYFVYFMGVIVAVLHRRSSSTACRSSGARARSSRSSRARPRSSSTTGASSASWSSSPWPRPGRASASGCSTRSRRSGPRSTTRGCRRSALIVFALMGVAPLLGWRKTSPELFKKSFRWPVVGDGRRRASLHLALRQALRLPGVRARSIRSTRARSATALARARVARYPFVTIALVRASTSPSSCRSSRAACARRQQTHADESDRSRRSSTSSPSRAAATAATSSTSASR